MRNAGTPRAALAKRPRCRRSSRPAARARMRGCRGTACPGTAECTRSAGGHTAHAGARGRWGGRVSTAAGRVTSGRHIGGPHNRQMAQPVAAPRPARAIGWRVGPRAYVRTQLLHASISTLTSSARRHRCPNRRGVLAFLRSITAGQETATQPEGLFAQLRHDGNCSLLWHGENCFLKQAPRAREPQRCNCTDVRYARLANYP